MILNIVTVNLILKMIPKNYLRCFGSSDLFVDWIIFLRDICNKKCVARRGYIVFCTLLLG